MNKKNDKSYFLGILSCVLALCWVYLIYMGLNIQKENNADKMLTKQKVMLSIPEVTAPVQGVVPNKFEQPKEQSPEIAEANIALLIDQMEYSETLASGLKTLPKEITIGISPYNLNIDSIAKIAKENNNDIFIELPFIGQNSEAPIKDYDLTPSFGTEEIQHRLQKMLEKTGNAVGVYNLGNEEFLNSPTGIATLVDNLHKANLFFLYGINGRTTVLESDNESVFTVEASDGVITKNQDKDEVMRELHNLEEVAKNNGKAIIVVQFDDNNISLLSNWLKTLEAKNIKLVSIKALPKKIKVLG